MASSDWGFVIGCKKGYGSFEKGIRIAYKNDPNRTKTFFGSISLLKRKTLVEITSACGLVYPSTPERERKTFIEITSASGLVYPSIPEQEPRLLPK